MQSFKAKQSKKTKTRFGDFHALLFAHEYSLAISISIAFLQNILRLINRYTKFTDDKCQIGKQKLIEIFDIFS